jgi:hypothetical protein
MGVASDENPDLQIQEQKQLMGHLHGGHSGRQAFADSQTWSGLVQRPPHL